VTSPAVKSPPVVLCILDGIGWGRRDEGDAVALAQTPHLDGLMGRCGWRLLQAHGTAVGMPSDNDMGNSEVGHNAMGAGRVFEQGAALVANAIASGDIWQSAAWMRAMDRCRAGGTLHLLGLVSDGNVHSHVAHLHALIARARAQGAPRVRVHALTDGRDVAGRSALQWIPELERTLADDPGDAAIASGGGRMNITMDRYEADWDMVARGWRCHVHADAPRHPTASHAIEAAYAEAPDRDDQWLPAFVVGDYDGMKDGDACVLFNFRGDRAMEISRAFEGDPSFDSACFDRGHRPDVAFAGMMQYDGDLAVPKHYLVAPPQIDETVGAVLALAGKRSLAVSETQKFGHVTYFFHGNRSEPPAGEEQREIPSDNVPFDQAPEMKAAAITADAVTALERGGLDHIRLNLANGDMVGHTGNLEATVRAVEIVDACVGRLAAACDAAGAMLLVTADHGNADEMFRVNRKTGAWQTDTEGRPTPCTSHSLNPVPVILVDPTDQWRLTGEDGELVGGLAGIAATLLVLCGVTPPTSFLPALVVANALPSA
jgi:2,3-bisphosphoglycerate-independent phosphoglycerate mutase